MILDLIFTLLVPVKQQLGKTLWLFLIFYCSSLLCELMNTLYLIKKNKCKYSNYNRQLCWLEKSSYVSSVPFPVMFLLYQLKCHFHIPTFSNLVICNFSIFHLNKKVAKWWKSNLSNWQKCRFLGFRNWRPIFAVFLWPTQKWS